MTEPSRARRVVVPLAAAAGVLAVVGVAVWAGTSGRGSDTPPAARPAAELAGAEASASGSEPTEAVIDPEPRPGQKPGPTPVGGQPWQDAVTTACERELRSQGADGLRQVAQIGHRDGGTSFWSDTSGGWLVCDYLSTAPRPVLLGASEQDGEGFTEQGLAMGSTAVSGSEDPGAVHLVAGGKLPWPVEELSYEFPDGHTARARFVESADGSGDTWWAVTRTLDALPPAMSGPEARDESVTVSVVGGAAEAFRLPWRQATCAQLNPGCPSAQ